MPSKKMRTRAWKSSSPACDLRLVMPEGPGDLSGSVFFTAPLSSLGANGAMNRECIIVVAIEACSFTL